MTLSIILSSLGSRAARAASVAGGVRRFAVGALSSRVTGDVVSKLWNGFTRFGGFLVGRIISNLSQGLVFSFTALWGFVVSARQFLWNFNWNASDEELDASIKSAFNALGSSLGGTLGNALGWLACGALPGAVVMTFNEPLALHILKEVGEEALDEIAGNLSNLIRQTANSAVRAGFTYIYKNVRSLYRESSDTFRTRLYASGITNKETLDKAVADRNKPWSFASATEEAIESIPNEFLRNLVEEMAEEFSDSCIEAGYVVAGGIDSYLASARQAYGGILGVDRTVEILLNRTPAASPTSGGTP